MITSKKLNEFSIEITKTTTPAPIVEKLTYERDFIEKQIESIKKQRDALIADKERELAECESILSEMNKLDIKVKPIEVAPVEEIISVEK